MKFGVSSALLLLSAPGCFYSFENPVELQDAGSIAGRVTFTSNPANLSPAGGQVGLLWTDLAISVQEDGRFLFLGLPDGVYTLKYELDPGDGGLPLIAFLPGITLPQEPGNIPDAIDLGQIVLSPAARVTGHVSGLDGGTAVVGAFSVGSDGGEIYESFTVMTDDGGNFTLDLPHGSHDIWASTSALSGSMPVTVPSGQVTDLGELALSPPALGGSRANHEPGSRADPNNGDPNGELVGDLVLGLPGYGAGASPGQVEDAGLVQSNVEINPPPPPQDPFSLSGQVPGRGAHMDQTLPPGQLYPSIFCGLKGAQAPGPATLNDIGLNNIPTFVGHATILGQITWLPVSTFAANRQAPPPDYPSGTTTGGTGGTTSGGGTSSGGGTGTGGILDAGPHGWLELAEGPVADGGTDLQDDPFIPVPVNGGTVVFYNNNQILHLAAVTSGGLTPLLTLDTGGGSVTLLAATADELGVPTAIVNYYSPLNASSALTVVQPGTDGNWILSTCLQPSYLSYGQVALLPAPQGSVASKGPSAYALFFDANAQLNLASVYAANGNCTSALVGSPTSGDAGIGQFQYVTAASCILNGDPGACVGLGAYSDSVSALGIDLLSPPNALTDPLAIWSGPRAPYVPADLTSVITGPPGSELFTVAWYLGLVDPVAGDLVAQRAPVVDLTVAGAGAVLPPPILFDAGIDTDAGTPLYSFLATQALSSGGVPFLLAQGRSNAFSTFVPPLQNFAFDLVSGAPFPDLPLDAGVASRPRGYVDANGNPVVALPADDPTSLNAQIWTYDP